MYAGKLRAMATLGDILGIEVVVRDRVEQCRATAVVSWCTWIELYECDRIVTLNVAKVNADNQRTVTTELVLTYGICLPTLLNKRESEVHIFQ